MFDSLFGFWKILIIFVVQKFQNHNIIHYLDDDLFVGEQNTGTLHCVKLAEIVKLTCRELGIPINEKKKPNYWGIVYSSIFLTQQLLNPTFRIGGATHLYYTRAFLEKDIT